MGGCGSAMCPRENAWVFGEVMLALEVGGMSKRRSFGASEHVLINECMSRSSHCSLCWGPRSSGWGS